MGNLSIEIEVQDFDLETIGFYLNVLDPATKAPKSNSYLRMSLAELDVFVEALKAAAANINLAAPNGIAGKAKSAKTSASSSDKLAPKLDLVEKQIATELAYSEKSR